MTSKINLFAMLIAAQCMLFSCISNDTEIVTYDDVAITSFTLGTVKCYRTVKASDGSDSTYYYTYSAANFPMHIDQRNNLIFNVDSLTAGTSVSRVLVSLGTRNSGIVTIKNIDDDEYTYYSSSDSVDLSQPRILRVTSNDGQHSKQYTVKVAVHNEYADSFTWNTVQTNIAAELAAMQKMKAIYSESVLFLLGYNGTDTKLLKSSDGAEWDVCTLTGIEGELSQNATIGEHDGMLYLLDNDVLYTSADGDTWTQVTAGAGLKSILGGFKSVDDFGDDVVNELYAMSESNAFMVSHDKGATWAPDNMESSLYYDNSDYLPSTDVTLVSTLTNTDDETGSVTVIANKSLTEGDTFTDAVVWNKIADKDDSQGWFYTNTAWENHYYVLPRMNGLSATGYADGIVAIGGDPINNEAQAYSEMYYSPDHGATWHKVNGMHMPEGFTATKVAVVVADDNGYIYLISNGDSNEGQVWRGRKNSATWNTNKKYFD